MIVQCPACRELVHVERLVLDEHSTRAGVSCAACRQVSWLPLAPPSTDARELASAVLSRSTPSEALLAPSARAGLSAANVSGETSALPSASPREADPVLDEALASLPAEGPDEERIATQLRALLPRWDDVNAHRALIRSAHEAGALPALGLRYRKVLEVRPGDETAKRAQQEILNLAFASFSTLASATDRGIDVHKRVRTVVTLAASAMLLLFAFALLYFLLRGP